MVTSIIPWTAGFAYAIAFPVTSEAADHAYITMVIASDDSPVQFAAAAWVGVA
jgi:hypothetical protein